jgi:predicted phosphate transport protein (TIGR00153 family)
MSSNAGSFTAVPLPSLVPKDRVFFDLFNEAGQNNLRSAHLLKEMLENWPEDRGLGREILLAEQEGDRITHDITRRLNTTFVTPLDREDIYALATQLDDIVDDIEETADFLGLYKIEAPMQQALGLADVLVKTCEQLAEALAHLRGFKDLEKYWIEIHRLENDGDRLHRDAVASLFANGIDPMVVIRWKDIFLVLERAIDACETAAHILEGIVIKNS